MDWNLSDNWRYGFWVFILLCMFLFNIKRPDLYLRDWPFKFPRQFRFGSVWKTIRHLLFGR